MSDGNFYDYMKQLPKPAIGLGIPRHLIAGDFSSSNYSATVVLQEPAFLMFKQLQESMVKPNPFR